MNDENLKKKTISSLIWSACQRFGTLILAFVGNLILARFLTPEDYGVVGMLTIFISLSEAFIDSGLGAALIQKDNPSEVDYSTVFWTNIVVSVFFYTVLFFAAPLIANFYGMEILKNILRIKGIVLIIQAFRIIQTTKLQKELNFKTLSIVFFICSLISTITSIILAFFSYKNTIDLFKIIFYIKFNKSSNKNKNHHKYKNKTSKYKTSFN
jgi:O-antigen/teichoic acid export membrane protein